MGFYIFLLGSLYIMYIGSPVQLACAKKFSSPRSFAFVSRGLSGTSFRIRKVNKFLIDYNNYQSSLSPFSLTPSTASFSSLLPRCSSLDEIKTAIKTKGDEIRLKKTEGADKESLSPLIRIIRVEEIL